MWFDHDEFHFVWKRMRGDFTLTTRAQFGKTQKKTSSYLDGTLALSWYQLRSLNTSLRRKRRRASVQRENDLDGKLFEARYDRRRIVPL